MKTIYKYDILIETPFSIRMPTGAKILSLQKQNGEPKIWAEVDTSLSFTIRNFIIYPTGFKMWDNDNQVYIGTF
jgi:hypothetical protein